MTCLLQRHGCRVEEDSLNLYFYDLRTNGKWAIRKSELPPTQIAASRFIHKELASRKFECCKGKENSPQANLNELVRDLMNYLFTPKSARGITR